MTTPDVPGLHRVGPVAILSGAAARAALDACLIAHGARRQSGLPTSRHLHALAQVLAATVAASGQTDDRMEPVVTPSILKPLTVSEAAELLGLSHRSTRRLAPKLGGRRVGGQWQLDRQAVLEHLEGKHDGQSR